MELVLELVQPHMTQKPLLRGEVEMEPGHPPHFLECPVWPYEPPPILSVRHNGHLGHNVLSCPEIARLDVCEEQGEWPLRLSLLTRPHRNNHPQADRLCERLYAFCHL